MYKRGQAGEACQWMVRIEPHSGWSVSLDNRFNDVWELLSRSKHGVPLKTIKKKTCFIAKAIMATPKDSGVMQKAIVFLRDESGRLAPASTCFECCWGHYYSCYPQRIGMYCKSLDTWASVSSRSRSQP